MLECRVLTLGFGVLHVITLFWFWVPIIATHPQNIDTFFQGLLQSKVLTCLIGIRSMGS